MQSIIDDDTRHATVLDVTLATGQVIIIIITKIYIAHYCIAPNALTVSVRSSE